MYIRYLRSFDRSYKKLERSQRERVDIAVRKLLLSFETGVRTEGLGFKKLTNDYWEIRADIRTRIILAFDSAGITLHLTGDHDQIKKFIKNV